MSIQRRLATWLRLLTRPPIIPTNPDCFDLRTWADLPVHHPRCQ